MVDMKTKRMLEIMNIEYQIFKEIEAISKKKTDYIIKRQIEELEKITEIENRSATELEALEKERDEIVKYLAKIWKIDRDHLDILSLSQAMNDEDAKELIHRKEKISKVIGELKNLNELNGKLLKNAMEYVDFFMNLVTNNSDSTDNNYSNLGKLSENSTPRRVFDLKL